jgi:hypothetical protein
MLSSSTQLSPPRAENFLLDLVGVPAAVAFGLRRLRSTYFGNCLRIRRSSDNTEADIGFISNGMIDFNGLLTFVGGGNGLVRTWYDQSVNGLNANSTVNAQQGVLVSAGVLQTLNSRPTIVFDGTNHLHISSITFSRDVTLSAVSNKSLFVEHGVNTNSTDGFYFWAKGTQPSAYRRSALVQTNPNADWAGTPLAILSARFNASQAYFKNLTQIGIVANSATDTSLALAMTINGRNNVPNVAFFSELSELILYASSLTDSQMSALAKNQGAHHGITI